MKRRRRPVHQHRPTKALYRHLLHALLVVSVAPAMAGDFIRLPVSDGFCEMESHPHNVLARPLEPAWSYRNTAVRSLERLRRKVEEWGVTTISQPIAVLAPDAFSVPDDIVTPREAFDLALKERQGLAYQSLDIGINNQFSGVVTPTLIPGQLSPAPGCTATTTTTSTTTATAPPLFGSDGKIRGPLDAESLQLPTPANVGGFGSFTQPFSLLPASQALNTSTSFALRQAQDMTVRQKIYRQMSTPQRVRGHTVVFFCIVQVSCNPGWRTQEHYIADCSASLEYFDICKKQTLSRAQMRSPSVFSVLPLIDAQTVEMANSQREVTQLAFQLAASLPARGVDIKAKDLFEFVRRYSRDVRTVTPIPVVNSYSSGSTFGFRFSPSFQAMRDPARKGTQPANVLLPTTFPALVTVVMHVNDLRAAAAEFGRMDFRTVEDPLPEGMSVLVHSSTRWYLKDREPLWKIHKRLFSPMKRDSIGMEIGAAQDVAEYYRAKDWYERLRRGRAAYKKLQDNKHLENTHEDPESKEYNYDPVLDEMRRSIIDLQSKGLGRSWPVYIGGYTLAMSEKQAAANLAEQDAAQRFEKEKKKLETEYKKRPLRYFMWVRAEGDRV